MQAAATTDNLTPAQRSETMRRVRSKDTTPEWKVRRLTHALGYRYRLHGKGLPGRPDLVFAGRRKVIFVHGCFWHRHSCKKGQEMPASRQEYWAPKFERTRRRDRQHVRDLKREGWQSMVVWECQTIDVAKLEHRIRAFLEG